MVPVSGMSRGIGSRYVGQGLGTNAVNGADRNRIALERMLLRSDFAITRSHGDGEEGETPATYAFWGRASETRVDGAVDGLSLGGDVVTGLFGADYAKES